MPAKTKTAQGKAETTPAKESTKPAKPTTVKKPDKAKKPAVKAPKKKVGRKPKPPVITDEAFEKWYLSRDTDHFKHYAKLWNEANLKIKIPNLDGYDDWLNYFKNLSPTVIKKLATTGLDFLPTDGYAALSRWHDIVTHPHRIDKIHQTGLTRKAGGKGSKTIVELAAANDRLGVLKATRDRLAEKLEKGAAARDTAALAREMTEVMTQIAEYERRQGPKKETKLGQLLGDVDLRKRPPQNGGGHRNTSFSSRVTIKEVEGTK